MRFTPGRCFHCGGPPLKFTSEYGLIDGRILPSDRVFFCSDEHLDEEVYKLMPPEFRGDNGAYDDPRFAELEKQYLAARQQTVRPVKRLRSNEELEEIRLFDQEYEQKAERFAADWQKEQEKEYGLAIRKLRKVIDAHQAQEREKEAAKLSEAEGKRLEKLRLAEEERRLAEEAEAALQKGFNEVPLPDEQRFAGHWIIAPPGRGKTTLLHALFLNDLQAEASIVVIDSKGDLIEPIKKLWAVKDRLVLIEPDPDFPLALNPLDIPKTNVAHTISLLEYVFSALLEARMTALQQTLFRSVLPALVQVIPNPTLETFREIITGGVGRYEQYIRKLPLSQQEFFFDRETGFLSKTYTETRNQLIWRLQFLMTNPIIRQMFGAMKTKFDIGREMDAGKIILINNSKAVLGDEGAEFFGRFFIALILAAAQQRAGRRNEDKLPCFVYIDECHNVIRRDEKIPTILDECRSQKIGLILAHQRSAQLDPKVLDAVANCGVRFANSDDEARFLADKMRTTPEFLRSLPRGTFAAFVRDLTPQALALKIPFVDMDALPKMTASEQRMIRDRMREQYSFTPETHNESVKEVAREGDRTSIAAHNSIIVSQPPSTKPAIPKADDEHW